MLQQLIKFGGLPSQKKVWWAPEPSEYKKNLTRHQYQYDRSSTCIDYECRKTVEYYNLKKKKKFHLTRHRYSRQLLKIRRTFV